MAEENEAPEVVITPDVVPDAVTPVSTWTTPVEPEVTEEVAEENEAPEEDSDVPKQVSLSEINTITNERIRMQAVGANKRKEELRKLLTPAEFKQMYNPPRRRRQAALAPR